MEKKNPIEEAKRYLQNAKDILKEKAIKEDNNYKDSKYVRMAGDTAWKGCLIALDVVFKVKETMSKGKRVSIDDYKDKVSKREIKSTWGKNRLIPFFMASYIDRINF